MGEVGEVGEVDARVVFGVSTDFSGGLRWFQWSPMVLSGRGPFSVALGRSATDGSGLAVVEPSRGLAQDADLVDWTAGWGL